MRSFHVVTFGCQMNQHDSDRIRDVLGAAGYVAASSAETADLILLNTCSVREKAEQKLRSEVGRLGMLKRQRPSLVIAVAGCVAQQEGERLIKKMPQIDVVIGPDQAPLLPQLLDEVERGGLPQVRTVFDVDAPRFLPAGSSGRAKVSDFVTIMKGCDERCTFCVVPTTRGPERYRPAAEILDEVERLVARGVREVTLLGQTVDSYADPRGELVAAAARTPRPEGARGSAARRDESEFPSLLRAVAARVPQLARLRYTSPHPRHLTRALIEAHRDLPVLARHVHMPVQSGSDRVLKRMLRRYSVSEYVERVSALRQAAPGLTLSTDIIVGFPGETAEDFELTLELVRRVGFVGVFGFKYSARPFTAALKLGDDVPEEEKSARLERLFELSEAQRAEHLATLVGSVQTVLVEGPGEREGYTGRTERNEIVHLDAAEDVTGQLVEVEIVRAFKHSLAGAPRSARLRPPAAVRAASAPAQRRPRALPLVPG